jgi:hypothetical protein
MMQPMVDEHAATDLKLYIDNNGALYRRQTLPILKNLATHLVLGDYTYAGAIKAFERLVESGAKEDTREHGGQGQPWHSLFDVATRRRVAEELTEDFEREARPKTRREIGKEIDTVLGTRRYS